MSIPMVAYEGRMSYCLIKSIQMVLAHQGHQYPLPWLECVSGETFGFAYIRDGVSFFAINGHPYHRAGEHLLQTLGFRYSYSAAPDNDAALRALAEALADGPVVVGMLDMGYLSYAPNHQAARGADHAIVVLALRPDEVVVHDPDGYPAVSLPLGDFLEAWQRDIYTGKPYGLWRIGEQQTVPEPEAIWERTIARARFNFTFTTEDYAEGVTFIYGPAGMRALAADLVAGPERPLGGLPYFNWRVSGQRCLDSAFFLRERLPDAAAIRWEQCQIYGALQTATVRNDRAAMAALLERLAEHETRLIAAIG